MRYHVTYHIEPHPDGLERADVPEDAGACTALILLSCLYPEDGSYSMLPISVDGRTGGRDLSDAELWKAWALWARALSKSETLTEGKREICAAVFQAVQNAIRSAEEATT